MKCKFIVIVLPTHFEGKKSNYMYFRNFPLHYHAAHTRCPYYYPFLPESLVDSLLSATQHFLVSPSSKLYSKSSANLPSTSKCPWIFIYPLRERSIIPPCYLLKANSPSPCAPDIIHSSRTSLNNVISNKTLSSLRDYLLLHSYQVPSTLPRIPW